MNDAPRPPGRRWPRQRLGQAVLFVTIPGVLLGATSMTAAYSAGWMDAEPTQSVCHPVVVAAPARGSFTVNVLNATGRTGVAGQVAASLGRRKFSVHGISNAPESWYVTQSAVVHHGPQGLDQALLTAAQIPGAKLFADERTGTSVDVVVGLGYEGELTQVARPQDLLGPSARDTVTRPCP